MTKIINSLKTEVILVYRNFWSWLSILLFCFIIGVQFHSRIIIGNPGDMLTSTAFIVQGGIIVSLLLSYFLTRSEEHSDSLEVFYTIHDGFKYKIIGKILAFIVLVLIFQFISLIELYLFFYMYHAPFIFYLKAIEYLLMYWTLPFLIAGMIGFSVGLFFKNRLVYLFIVLISILVGPLNSVIFENLSSIFKIDFTSLAIFLNMGQTDPHAPFDPVYGFPLEIGRWSQKVLWVFLTFLILFISILIKGKLKLSRASFITLGVIVALIFPVTSSYLQPQQIIRTAKEWDSVQKYDREYYRSYTPAYKETIPFSIKSYDIEVQSYRDLKVKTSIEVVTEKESKNLVFTLYHNLRVDSILDWNGNRLEFNQIGDQINVHLQEKVVPEREILLTFIYEGNSSPYFYANELAVMLPNYFNWLPVAGAYQSMISDGMNLYRLPLHSNEPIKYSLSYTGPDLNYTNLKKTSKNRWEGVSSTGVTLVSGMLTEKETSGIKIIYPVSLYKKQGIFPEFMDKYRNILGNITNDLNMVDRQQNNIVFLSIPHESINYPSNIWIADDHLLVGINQYFSDFLNDESFAVPAITSALIRNANTVQQNQDSIRLFILSYEYWYELKYLKEQTEMPLIERELRSYENGKIKDKQYYTTKKIVTFINENRDKNDIILKFLRGWLIQIQSEKGMDIQSVDNMLNSYEG